MDIKADSDSAASVKTLCDHHLVFVSSDLTDVPKPDTPCNSCHHPDQNWFCLSCKEVLCGNNAKKCFRKHYLQTKHCLAVNCSGKSIWCRICNKIIDPQVIQQLKANGRSFSSKLESVDAMIVDVTDLLSKPFPSTNFHPQLDAKSSVGQDEAALAMAGLQKIFDRGLKALADPQVQEEFHLYSATFLSADSCPSELKVNLSSFTRKLSEEISSFVKAQDELKVVSDLSASITRKKFVLLQQTSKYDEVKKEILASDKKVSDLKAMIKELEACLATEESNRAKIDEVINSIETQITTARDGLVSDLGQVSSMEGRAQAAKQLLSQQQSAWDKLKNRFTKFAIA